MRIRLAIPDHLVTPEALEAALEATALANEQAVLRGEVPGITEAIKKGVRWKPEPFLDGEHFDLAHQVVNRNWGDCDDLAPWLAGQLRATGEDEGARPRVYKTGPKRWHVVTELSDGTILDPSRWAGMGKRSAPDSQGVVGQIARPFARPGGGAACVVPHQGRWWSRVDVPFADADAHLASHARGRTPEQALNNAFAGAICCGEAIESPLCDRARDAGRLLLSPADEHIGSLFSALKGIAKGAAGFIPGGSAALSAASMASKLAHGHGKAHPDETEHGPATVHPSGGVSVPVHDQGVAPDHGQHMMIMYHPQYAPGPVLMRF